MQNKAEQEDDVKVTFVRTTNQSKTIYAERSPMFFQKLMKSGKACIGWERFPVYEDISIPRCFNCQGFYHKSNQCKNRAVCLKCSGNHQSKDCQNNILKCINCEEANIKLRKTYDTTHQANDQECPSIQHHMKLLKAKINYGQIA